MQDDDRWCLISFRSPRASATCTSCADGSSGRVRRGRARAVDLPDYLADEVEQIPTTLGCGRDPLPLETRGSRASCGRRQLVVGSRRARRARSLRRGGRRDEATPVDSDRDGFIGYMRVIDSWRVLPYVDPACPPRSCPTTAARRASTGSTSFGAARRARLGAVQTVTRALVSP